MQKRSNTSRKSSALLRTHNCCVIFGPVSMTDFPKILSEFSRDAVCDISLADRIGASFVVGEPADIEAFRQSSPRVSEQRQRDRDTAKAMGLDAVAQWLAEGERGYSSNAMCKHLFGLPGSAGIDYPLDPDDLRRCIDFVEATNAHEIMPRMATVSRHWALLVGAWSELEACLRNEMASGKSAPQTLALMRALGQ